MITYPYEYLFRQDSVHKQLIITDGEITLTNSDIYQESFELEEILSATRDLTYGSCNSATLKFTTFNLSAFKGRTLTVSVVLDGHIEDPFTFGTYKVYEDKLTADRTKKDILCHDALYEVINANVIDWYNTILPDMNTTVTLKQFRDSFFNHFGITQEAITLDNDTETIAKTVSGEVLSGAEVLRRICEMNGVFGRINRQGNFEYFYVHATNNPLYPALTLYPDINLFPSFDGQYDANVIGENGTYISAQYEDYDCMPVDKLIIRQEDGDAGVEIGTGTNKYIIQGNFLLFGKSATDLTRIANKIYTHIADGAYYRPCEIELKGNPCIEIGDGIALVTRNNDRIVTFVTHRVYSGIQAQRDIYSAEGTEYRDEDVNSFDTQIKQLREKSNILTRDLEHTESVITDEILDPDNPTSLVSRIEQTSDSISAEVTRATTEEGKKLNKTSPTGQTSFSWEMTDSKMEWKQNGNRIMLLNSSGLEIKGKVTAESGYIGNGSSGFTIANTSIYNSDTNNEVKLDVSSGLLIRGNTPEITVKENENSTVWNESKIDPTGIRFYSHRNNNSIQIGDLQPYFAEYGTAKTRGLNLSLAGIDDTSSSNAIVANLYMAGAVPIMNGTTPTGKFTPVLNFQNANNERLSIEIDQVYAPNAEMYAISFNQTSDRRKKKDIEKLDNEKATKFILSLKPCEFKMKEDDTKHHGFIAQEIKESMYDDWDLHKENDGTQYLSYTELIADMVATIQNLQKQIDELKGENDGK